MQCTSKRNLTSFSLFCAILLTVGNAIAADTEIFVSPAGNDGGAGTREAPLKSIAAALKKAAPGTTIRLLEGTYKEAITFPTSGEEGKPISLCGEGKATLDPTECVNSKLALVGRDIGFIVIDGIIVTGHRQGIKFKNCHDIVVRKCVISKGNSGVSLEGSSAKKMLFEDIETFANVNGGFDVADGVAMEDVTYRRCSAHDNECADGSDGFGISHKAVTQNVLYEGCQAYKNGSDGFDISGKTGHGVTLRDCVSHNNGTKKWGANFKCWNPGSVFISCVGYVTGETKDGNFEAHSDNISFINCTSGANDDCGLVVDANNVKIVNCLFTGAKNCAVRCAKDRGGNARPLTIEHCMVSGCEPGAITIGKNDNINGDAAFVDVANGDYRLKKGSLAGNHGLAMPEAAKDAAGVTRPKVPTIGAYEPQQ